MLLFFSKRGTWWHRHGVCVAGVAVVTSTLLVCGRPGVWWHVRHFCLAAWRLVTCASLLFGRRGIWWHRRCFCVAGVKLTSICQHTVRPLLVIVSHCIPWSPNSRRCVAAGYLSDFILRMFLSPGRRRLFWCNVRRSNLLHPPGTSSRRPFPWWSAQSVRRHCSWCQNRCWPVTRSQGAGNATLSHPNPFHAKLLSHTTLSNAALGPFTRNSSTCKTLIQLFTCNSSTCLPHTTHLCPTKLVTHNSFTHTQLFHSQLFHTYKTLTHLAFAHRSFTYISSTHTSFTHSSCTQTSSPRNSFTDNPFTHSSATHNSLAHGTWTSSPGNSSRYTSFTHNSSTNNSFTHNSCTQLLFVFPAFSVPF